MLVYIASLPHSGSTLLSLLLATHARVVALGEVRLQIAKLRRDPEKSGAELCGCGAEIRRCPLWGRFIDECSAAATPADDLRLVVRLGREVLGPDLLFVDASKIREPVEEMAGDPHCPMKIIHLSRDYRSWIVSAADTRERKKKRRRAGWLEGLQSGRRWWRENGKLEQTLAAVPFPSIRVGYEELVLVGQDVWPILWEFLGLDNTGAPADFAGSRNHIFFGNRMRGDAMRKTVRYDDRWLGRSEWRSASLLLPGLGSANRRFVYSHGVAGREDKAAIERLAASHGLIA